MTHHTHTHTEPLIHVNGGSVGCLGEEDADMHQSTATEWRPAPPLTPPLLIPLSSSSSSLSSLLTALCPLFLSPLHHSSHHFPSSSFLLSCLFLLLFFLIPPPCPSSLPSPATNPLEKLETQFPLSLLPHLAPPLLPSHPLLLLSSSSLAPALFPFILRSPVSPPFTPSPSSLSL